MTTVVYADMRFHNDMRGAILETIREDVARGRDAGLDRREIMRWVRPLLESSRRRIRRGNNDAGMPPVHRDRITAVIRNAEAGALAILFNEQGLN